MFVVICGPQLSEIPHKLIGPTEGPEPMIPIIPMSASFWFLSLTLLRNLEVKPLPAAQQLKLVSQLCGLPSEHAVLNGLMAYGKALRTAAKSDAGW